MSRPGQTGRAAALAFAALLGCRGAAGADPAVLDARVDEPRAYGYQVGDLVTRRVDVQVPAGLQLDEKSLPRPGARGLALELRQLERERIAGGERFVLTYQVFIAPAAVRTFEMPAFTLRWTGVPRDQEQRIEAWPVTVAPLVPVEVSSRRGLGDLQPDATPMPIDTTAARARLVAWGAGIAAAGLWLAALQFGLPWRRRTGPFAAAWGRVRRLPADDDSAWRAACRHLHAALDATAGAVLFERELPAFLARHPAFAALDGEIRRFLMLSRREFFAGAPRDPGDAAWLVDFCRRCRDAERGA
jgi:mxaA protein